MTLFSAPDEAASHRTRIVLAEKDVEIEIEPGFEEIETVIGAGYRWRK